MALDTTRLRNPELKKYADDHFNKLCRLVNFGAPLLADVDKIVTSTNMKVGSYTVAAQPDVPRNITVTQTVVATGEDTNGTITVTGTNALGHVITEVITPNGGATVAGLKAFKTVTSVVGAGWVIAGGNDTIEVGIGTVLGLPFAIAETADVVMGVLGTTITATTVTAGAVEVSTVDMSTGTYDGSKVALAFVVE